MLNHTRMILVSLPVEPEHQVRIRAAAQDCEIVFRAKDEILPDELARAEIIFGTLPPEMLKKAENLQWVHLNSAGADVYTRPGALDAQIALTNSVGAYGLTVSEHMLAMLFCMNRRFPEYVRNQEKNLWQSMGRVRSVEGAAILVLGLGNIGGDFARKVKALGAYTMGTKRTIGPLPEYMDELHTLAELDDLLPRADVVANCLPLTPETKGLFNEKRLLMMKKDALLINIGRGPSVDTDALLKVMNQGHLAGAALDVTDPEPLPADHPLWQQERVLITPHVAGFFHLPETKNRVVGIFCENLRRYLAGETMRNLVAHG